MKKSMLCLASAVLVPGLIQAAEPVMRVGILTDTHVTPDIKSCALVKKGFEVFKENKVDMVVHCGDLSDYSFAESYRNYRQVWNEVFTGKQPRQIFLYANHDDIVKGGGSGKLHVMKEELDGNEYYTDTKINGYHFITVPQSYQEEKYRDLLAKASADTPDKPIFVFDHVPAGDTVYNSQVWGSLRTRGILEKYPNVIQISGHIHGTSRNELCIWQGDFTVVDAGCIQVWNGDLVGTAAQSKKTAGALIMELYKDKAVFRRFLLPEKNEYRAETPWTVPLPFNKETAPYNNKFRSSASPKPFFKKGSAIIVKTDKPFSQLSVTFPEAEHPDRVFQYRIELARKNAEEQWEKFARQDAFGDFYLNENKRTGKQTQTFSAGYFEDGKEYRVMVTPENFFGGAGEPLSVDFKAPEKPKTTVVFESFNPMKECPFMSGLADGEAMPKQDGWYLHDVYNARLEFPTGIWKENGKYRFTVDLRMIQPDRRWTVVLRNPVPLQNANPRIATPPGDSGLQRIVIEFTKRRSDFFYYLLIREGGRGKIRFEYVKIEKTR